MVDIVTETKNRFDFFNSAFLMIYISIALLTLSILFIVKSRAGWKKSLGIISVSLGMTFVLESLFWFVGYSFGRFQVMCASFSDCPSQFENFLFYYLPYTAVFIFIVVLFICSLILFFRRNPKS